MNFFTWGSDNTKCYLIVLRRQLVSLLENVRDFCLGILSSKWNVPEQQANKKSAYLYFSIHQFLVYWLLFTKEELFLSILLTLVSYLQHFYSVKLYILASGLHIFCVFNKLKQSKLLLLDYTVLRPQCCYCVLPWEIIGFSYIQCNYRQLFTREQHL